MATNNSSPDYAGDLSAEEAWALLKSDPKAFFTACSKAQAAADCLRSAVLADSVAQAA